MSTNHSLEEVNWLTVLDLCNKNQQALGFIADHVQDPQLCSALMLIEESMDFTTNIVQNLINVGIDEEEQIKEDVPFE